jgi:hypothetical protein
MANTAVSHVDQSKLPVVSGVRTLVAFLFSAWLALVFVLAARSLANPALRRSHY